MLPSPMAIMVIWAFLAVMAIMAIFDCYGYYGHVRWQQQYGHYVYPLKEHGKSHPAVFVLAQ